MRKVPLSKGEFALVDDDDFDRVMSGRVWKDVEWRIVDEKES